MCNAEFIGKDCWAALCGFVPWDVIAWWLQSCCHEHPFPCNLRVVRAYLQQLQAKLHSYSHWSRGLWNRPLPPPDSCSSGF